MEEAVGIICISEQNNGIEGDSPQAQREAIERRAVELDLMIVNWFEYWESRSEDIKAPEQPVKEALDYCIKHKVKYAVFRDIERFTRGGQSIYEDLTIPLKTAGIKWYDVKKTISHEKINRLEEYGGGDVDYKWAVERKSEEAEAREAEEARRDRKKILARLIGNEIRLSRLGFFIGHPNFGYQLERQDTEHGSRQALVPRLEEAKYIKLIFDKKIEGVLTDKEIVEMLNGLGYKSRKTRKRHPDKNKKRIVIGYNGEKPLDVEQMYRYLNNPIYAGVMLNTRNGKKEPPRLFFGEPIVSIETWNKANEEKAHIYIDK